MINIEDIRGKRVHPNSKVMNFRWLMSNYEETIWIFHISKEGLYFAELEDYKTLQEAKNDLVSRNNVSKDGLVDDQLYIRDIKDGAAEIFYTVRALKYTLEKL